MRKYIKLYHGKLLLEDELLLSAHKVEEFLRESYFKRTLSLKRSFWNNFTCRRCNNKNKEFFQLIPCITCGTKHFYCRGCIQLGKVMECNYLYEWIGPSYKWDDIKNPLSWKGKLTNQQEEVSNTLIQVVKDKKEHLIWAVTGSGKTEMLFPCIAEAIKQNERVCIATPRADVVRELFPRIQQAFSSCHVQALYGGSRDKDGTAQIIIATTHQLMRFKNAFDLMIIDEVDAFPYHNNPSLKFATNRAKKNKAATILLTATPRNEQLFRIYSKKLTYSFVPLRFHHHLIPMPTLQYCSHLTKDIEHFNVPNKLIIWLKRRSKKERQLLIFVPTITYGEEIEREMAKILVENKLISDDREVTTVTSSDPLREEKIIKFRNKSIYCLITTTILERGVTFPSIDVAVIQANHEVFDEQALVQITGRVGRAKEDPTGEILFFHDGKTNAIKKALQMIQTMNKQAHHVLIRRGNE